MSPDLKILAMDFDGVIVDSILECAVSGLNGYSKYLGKTNFITNHSDINNGIIEKFRKTRPFIRTGEDYVYLFQAIDINAKINNQNDFDTFKRKYIERQDTYEDCFRSTRDYLLKNHLNEWLSLNPLYEGMKQFLTNNRNKIRIISTKSKKYILEILKFNSINLVENNVQSATKNNSKSFIINTIIINENINPENFYFIDDHIGILEEISALKVNCLLAGWGYNYIQQRNSIKNKYIESIDLNQFIDRFDGL